jgi:glutaredoxin 2
LTDDLEALSTLLGKKKNFIVDGEVHELDIVVYALLANILYFPMNSPLKERLQSYKNLCEFSDAMDKALEAKKNE